MSLILKVFDYRAFITVFSGFFKEFELAASTSLALHDFQTVEEVLSNLFPIKMVLDDGLSWLSLS